MSTTPSIGRMEFCKQSAENADESDLGADGKVDVARYDHKDHAA